MPQISNHILSDENQKGVNSVQQCSTENQKAAIAIDFVRQKGPSGFQQNIVE